MTIEQYLLIKNALNLQLLICLQEFALLYEHIELKKNGVCNSGIYDANAAQLQIIWVRESLILLDKCYKEKFDFKKTVETISNDHVSINLLPL